MNILLVDDEKLICSSLKKYLERNDRYNVDIVFKGCDALHKLDKKHFDLVMTDLNLPDFKDFELIEKIRTQNTNIPIITMSAQYPVSKDYVMVKHNIFKCISKPFDLDEIVNCVADVMKCGVNQGTNY